MGLETAVAPAVHGIPSYRQIPNRFGETRTLQNLGHHAYEQGDYRRAAGYYEEAITLCRRLGIVNNLGRLYVNQGAVLNALGDYEAALQHYERARQITTEMQDRYFLALTLHNIGVVHSHWGAYDEAKEAYEAALQIHRSDGRPDSMAWTVNNLGLLHQHLQEYEIARGYHEELLQVAQEKKLRRTEGVAWCRLGGALTGLGDWQAAAAAYRQAAAIQRELGQLIGRQNRWPGRHR